MVHVVPALAVVVLLHPAGVDQGSVVMQNGLGEAGGAGGEVDGGVVLLVQGDGRMGRGAEAGEPDAVLGVAGAILADVEAHPHAGDVVCDGIHTADKLRTEDQDLHIRQLQTILDLVGGISEIHGHGHTAGLQDAEIDGQPLQAVHQQDGHLGALLQAAAEEQIGEPVGPAVKILPAQLPAVGGIRAAFDQIEVPPGHGLVPLLGGIDLHQGTFAAVKSGVSFQKVSNNHGKPLFSQIKKPPANKQRTRNSCGTTSVYPLRGLMGPRQARRLYRALPVSPYYRRFREATPKCIPHRGLHCLAPTGSSLGKRMGVYWFSSSCCI